MLRVSSKVSRHDDKASPPGQLRGDTPQKVMIHEREPLTLHEPVKHVLDVKPEQQPERDSASESEKSSELDSLSDIQDSSASSIPEARPSPPNANDMPITKRPISASSQLRQKRIQKSYSREDADRVIDLQFAGLTSSITDWPLFAEVCKCVFQII